MLKSWQAVNVFPIVVAYCFLTLTSCRQKKRATFKSLIIDSSESFPFYLLFLLFPFRKLWNFCVIFFTTNSSSCSSVVHSALKMGKYFNKYGKLCLRWFSQMFFGIFSSLHISEMLYIQWHRNWVFQRTTL